MVSCIERNPTRPREWMEAVAATRPRQRMEVEVVVRVLRVVRGDGMRGVKATTREESIGSATVRLMVWRDAVYAPACTMPCCVGEGKRRSHPAATVSIGLSTVVDSVAACPFL